MSQIFDGLQRSEGERSGIDLSSLLGATELLQRAERRAASRWEGTVLTEESEAARISDQEVTLGPSRMTPIAAEPEELEATEVSPSAERLDIFGQFKSLQVSLPSQSRLPCLTESGSPAAEAIRLLGVRLRNLRRDRPLQKVLITSTIPKEGKSTVAANLACTLALRTQKRTLVLEGDLRHPSLSQMFGIGRNPGICECLEDERSLAASIYYLEGPNIWILPAGSAPSNALELLQSGRLSTLMDQLSLLFDWIIIDSPPVLPLADTSVWMRLADGILLTTRQGTTEKRQLQRGLDAIESKKLIGAIVNSSTLAAASDYYYYGPSKISQPEDILTR